jgi:NAD(P)-dependent dehydrogenase (short-subunit alcohol dehydrogenase family)
VISYWFLLNHLKVNVRPWGLTKENGENNSRGAFSMEFPQNPFSLHGKVSIVTGGGRGLGYGIARALGRAGSDLVVASRSSQELERAAEEIIKETGGRALPLPVDLTKEGEIERLVQTTKEEFGGIDILVNNAATTIRKPFLEVNPKEFDDVVHLNLRVVFFLTQAVVREMTKQRKGKIINIASLGAQIGLRNISVYTATKGGIASLTKTLALELAGQNINVNAIAPGYYRTKLTEALFRDEEGYRWVLSRIPMGRPGLPDDLGGAAVFLASSASDYVTGQVMFVDGGWIAG